MEDRDSRAPGDPQSSIFEPPDSFRWQAFFQRAGEPLFLLSRRRRLLFVNRAWEELTGLPAAQARGLVCRPRQAAEAGLGEEVLVRALAPPPEVLQGRFGRARRLVSRAGAARRWWDIEFLPLSDHDGLLGILGRITRVAEVETSALLPLPEKLVALRAGLGGRYSLDLLAGSGPALRRVADQARLASQTRVPVLLVGEPGTGKRTLARIIHHQSADREGTFACLDCARLPPAALAAALFGEEDRAWRTGQGTRYLREPSRLLRDLQLRLCELLNPVGEPPGPRVIAGCSNDPAEDVRTDRLLDDLHCALSPLVIALPPLRERRADLPRLVEQFLERASAAADRPVAALTADAWELLRTYGWPGNIRELYAVLLSACLRASGSQIDASDLPAYLRLAVRLDRTVKPPAAAERSLPLDQLLEQAERRLILLALQRAKGNKSRAAELLSIWRPRLLRRMEALGIADSEGS
jgi:transcriptional regulator with PAS, ATPase and Fis domain